MDLGTIKKNVDNGVIRSTRDFEHAVLLMFSNALMYNSAGEFVHEATLQMRKDAMEMIRGFRTAMDQAEEEQGWCQTARHAPADTSIASLTNLLSPPHHHHHRAKQARRTSG